MYNCAFKYNVKIKDHEQIKVVGPNNQKGFSKMFT